MTLVRRVARPMLASMFVVGGLDSLRHPDGKDEAAKPVIERMASLVPQLPRDPRLLVRINGAIHLVAGSTLSFGVLPRTSSLLLAGTMVPTTFAGHRFWEESDPGAKANQRIHFVKNLTMLGGLLIAAVDTEGHPSVGYRASKAAERARKRTDEVRKSTAKQASKARKSLPIG